MNLVEFVEELVMNGNTLPEFEYFHPDLGISALVFDKESDQFSDFDWSEYSPENRYFVYTNSSDGFKDVHFYERLDWAKIMAREYTGELNEGA